MNEIQIFTYNETPVRTVIMGNEPWFVLKDVCEVLGISKYRDTADRLDSDERGVGQGGHPWRSAECYCRQRIRSV